MIGDLEQVPFDDVIVARGDDETDTGQALERLTPTRDRADVALLNDSDLVAQIGRGSHVAFAEVYKRYGQPAHRLAALVGGDDADDIVQDVFLRLWDRSGRFDASRGSLRTFLMMQVRSRRIDLLRSGGSRRARETTNSADYTSRSAEDGALARIDGDESWSLLFRLDHHQRNAIGLAYFGDHSYREVAALLDVPEGTVKSRIRQGLTTLRKSTELADVDQIDPMEQIVV